jgi:O-antigen/teichoic acid export membrane protein
LFYFLLLPASLGIIFTAPLYAALIGIRDLAFIFRMHVNLAVLNIAASTLLIPLFGLYGAGVGLMLATAYNAVGIPLALAGWLPPWLAGLGMAGSSLVVVLNALRLAPARLSLPPMSPDSALPHLSAH